MVSKFIFFLFNDHILNLYIVFLQEKFLQNLNEATTEDFEIIRTKDLEIGHKYKIKKFELIHTKYGNKIIALLDFGTYFLPPRYARVIKDIDKNPEDIKCENLFLIFEGRRDDELQSPILKFEIIR